MLSGVILNAKDFKIFKSIIVLDPIAVVDVFSCVESSAKMAFHDDTMLKAEIVADTNCDISI